MQINSAGLPDDFLQRVEKTDTCWLWKGNKKENGYGRYFIGSGRYIRAHRFSWSHLNGEIPKGLLVLHKCDVRECVKPDHLYLGTHKDNMRDMRLKGRVASRLTYSQVTEIRKTYQRGVPGEFSQMGLAKKYGVGYSHIAAIVNNKLWIR